MSENVNNNVLNLKLSNEGSKIWYKRAKNSITKIDGVIEVFIDKNKNIANVTYNQNIIDKDNLTNEIINIFKSYDKKINIDIYEEAKQSYRKVLYLKGLDCGHCAAKVQEAAQKYIPHEKIVVDFATLRFIIETKDKDVIDNIFEIVEKVVRTVDRNVVVLEFGEGKKERVDNDFKIKKSELVIFIIGLVFLGCVMLSTGIKDFFIHETNESEATWYELILLILAFLFIGKEILIKFLKNVSNKIFFDEIFLMTIASVGAFVTNHPIEAVMVMLLYRIGSLLQERAINHSRRSISSLLAFEAKYAHVKIGNEVTDILVEQVLPKDIIVVRTGEMVPLDGKLKEGKSYFDTKTISGESLSTSIKQGEKILSGSINLGKVVEIEVTKPYSESMISKILNLVENASSSKAKSENFITKFAKYYTPIVIALAGIIAVGLPFINNLLYSDLINEAAFDNSIYRAMIFLVISCPCALVISIPLGFFGGVGMCSKRGILVKGSNYLEALTNIDHLVFDKTGTLTKGVFEITEVVVKSDTITENELISLLMYAEFNSTHPIGMSIVNTYGRDLIYSEIINDFQDLNARGVKATINGRAVYAGNKRLMNELKVNFEEIKSNGVIIHLVRDKIYLGYIVVGDVVKDEASKCISTLKKQEVKKVSMLTGDNRGIGEYVANMLSLDDVYTELLPNDKVTKLEEFKSKSTKSVVYIGDGINDAPVIASADVGIALGAAASDATIQIADIVIMSDNLEKVNEVVNIAKYTRRRIVENVIFALGTKFIVLFLGLFGEVPIWMAIFSDVGISLLAIFNSLRITKMYKKEKADKDEQK